MEKFLQLHSVLGHIKAWAYTCLGRYFQSSYVIHYIIIRKIPQTNSGGDFEDLYKVQFWKCVFFQHGSLQSGLAQNLVK